MGPFGVEIDERAVGLQARNGEDGRPRRAVRHDIADAKILELQQRAEVLEPLLQAAREGDVTLVYSALDKQHNQAVVIRHALPPLMKAPAV